MLTKEQKENIRLQYVEEVLGEEPVLPEGAMEARLCFKENGVVPEGDCFSDHGSFKDTNTQARFDIYSVVVECRKDEKGGRFVVDVEEDGKVVVSYMKEGDDPEEFMRFEPYNK